MAFAEKLGMKGVGRDGLGAGQDLVRPDDYFLRMVANIAHAGNPARATGFSANAAMWIDPHLKNMCMVDPVGGSVSFYDTRVTLEKV